MSMASNKKVFSRVGFITLGLVQR